MAGRELGQVITFYSYKGGTGRTMALANIACLLAQQANGERKVLIVDWDLEGPGLHTYFRDKFSKAFGLHPDPEAAFNAHPGLIELFMTIERATPHASAQSRGSVYGDATQLLEGIDMDSFLIRTDIEALWMLKAGSFSEDYADNVNTFLWEELYKRCPTLFRNFAELLARRFNYVLIDSRTGLTDIGGICTMLMPEKLVTVFTPNRQSLFGALELSGRAARYRRQSDDVRPFVILPVASRVDASRSALRNAWKAGEPERHIPGYQPAFEELFQEIYGRGVWRLSNYFEVAQIPHDPDYAYGEEIAVLVERGADRFSLSWAYQSLMEILVSEKGPWEDAGPSGFERSAVEQRRRAERAFASLATEDQKAARFLLTRLVRVALSKEAGEDTPQRVSLNDLPPRAALVASPLAREQIVRVETDPATGESSAELTDPGLIQAWPRLRAWLNDDRELLLWHQGLHLRIIDWERSGRAPSLLLRGHVLAEAERWLKARSNVLGSREESYILASRRSRERRRRLLQALGIVTPLVLLVVTWSLIGYWRSTLYGDLLESWGLPRELYRLSGHLQELSLNGAVNRIDWLRGAASLQRLELGGTRVQSLEGLPPSLESLDLTGTEITSFKGLPPHLRELKLGQVKDCQLKDLPDTLSVLDLGDVAVEDLKGLPASLKSLSLDGSRLQTLHELPSSLSSLSLSGFAHLEVEMWPPTLESLTLRWTQLLTLGAVRAVTLFDGDLVTIFDGRLSRRGEARRGPAVGIDTRGSQVGVDWSGARQ